VRSLQAKFSALVVALLLAASVGLIRLATYEERGALTRAERERGAALTGSLAARAAEPLLAGDRPALEALVRETAAGAGVAAVRVLDRDGQVAASWDAGERAGPGPPAPPQGERLRAAAPVLAGGVPVGEAQVELDLAERVTPALERSARRLAAVAAALVVLGVAAGLGFVALLVGPLRRLRAGVERLGAGDLGVRVPPTSRDEVGELTRAFNELGASLEQKDRIQSAFGRYVNDYVLARLLESGEDPELGGAEREVTILFADVRQFTRLSEGMKAGDVVSLLNEVFQIVSDRILARGGVIDKYMGDSVMAYFGAPLPQPDHAARAVAAALDIQRAMAERAAGRGSGCELPALHVGVGIHSGVVVVGNIGSEQRTDFTAVGDAVNVAHRLEKLAGPGEILVSEAVQRRVRGAFRLRFEGERRLSGRQEPVHTYAVEAAEEREGQAPAPDCDSPATS